MVSSIYGDHSPMFFESKIEDEPLKKRMWSIRDVAKYTGYAVGTLYNLASKELIPYRKKRGKLFFIPYEIQNWIEEGDI